MSFLRIFFMKRIARSLEEGTPLRPFLLWAIERDKVLRDYYESLQRLETQLSEDLGPFLSLKSEQFAEGSPLREVSRKIDRVFTEEHRWNFRWAQATAVAMLLFFGFLYAHYRSDDSQIAEQPPEDHSSIALLQPETLVTVADPLKRSLEPSVHSVQALLQDTNSAIPKSMKLVVLDWEDMHLELDPEAVDALAVQSKEVFSRIPLMDPTATQAISYMVQGASRLRVPSTSPVYENTNDSVSPVFP